MVNLLRKVVESLPEPALNYRWIASFSNAPSSQNPANQIIVESVNAGFIKTPPRNRFYGGMMWDYPEAASAEGVSIGFYESERYHVTGWLNEWSRAIFNPEKEEYGLPSGPTGYKRTLYIRMMGVESYSPTAVIVMERVWPSDRQPYEFNYTTQEGRIITQCQFAVDKVSVRLL
jgi:hypothetical protein